MFTLSPHPSFHQPPSPTLYPGSAPLPLPAAEAHDGATSHRARDERRVPRLAERDQDRRPGGAQQRPAAPPQELPGPAQLDQGAKVCEQQHSLLSQPFPARRGCGRRVPRVPLGPGPDHHDRVSPRLGQPGGRSVRASADQSKRQPGLFSSFPFSPNLNLHLLGCWRAPPSGARLENSNFICLFCL